MNAWDTFLVEIKQARIDLGDPKVVWYRGHACQSWTLTPSLLRYVNGADREDELFQKYRQTAALLLQKRDSDWETLFDMQHYYIPTRLLDWTEVLGIAVFFALLKCTEDACVYLLHPRRLNKKSIDRKEVKVVLDDPAFNYRTIYWERKPFPCMMPVAIEAPFQNTRMLAQKGVFTIHGDDDRPLDIQYPECIKKVLLPVAAREGAKEFLSYANINEYSVFPDMVGLAPFIKNLVALEEA